MNPILLIEDEHALASALAVVCRRLGAEVTICASGRRGLDALAEQSFGLVVLDIGLPDMSGIDVLTEIRKQDPHLPVVIITAHGNLPNAVAAKRLDASAYLLKPLDLREVQDTLRQVLSAPRREAAAKPRDALGLLVGSALALQRSFVEVAHACTSDAPVLITGPTGTGKTLTARVIHEQSARQNAPFVTLYCSALPEQLLESELFGYEKGAFTGALTAKSGHIERAEGGTLFLDEIADISPAIQAKLLRFVEERVFTRVGGREERRVDCRLITATNRSLREEVRAGRFREDLYYRLHVLEIALPPLRERLDDLPALASHFLSTLAPERHLSISDSAQELLRAHTWPGNVRELRNVLEHAVAVSSGPVILPQHLPRDLREPARTSAPSSEVPGVLAGWLDQKLRDGVPYREMHDELEAMALKHLLSRFDQKPTVLARETKMNRVTLRKKLHELARFISPGDIAADDAGGEDEE
ncbi:sigma-54-dependent transcriptional regulator [Verrucomicrobiota bacterium sgz303538]